MSKAEQILAALGGDDNIDDLEACITRLRVEVDDPSLVDEPALKAAGAFGVVQQGTSVQVLLAPRPTLWPRTLRICADDRYRISSRRHPDAVVRGS